MGLFFNRSKTAAQTTAPVLDAARACEILRFFPIGTTVDYYPEFKSSIVLETVIIGYRINNAAIYSAQEIRCEGEGAASRLTIGRERRPATPLTDLGIIIPIEGRNLGHLDYARRAELERTGGFTVGNNITLIARERQGRLPLVHSTVAKQTQVKDGPFARTPIAILDLDVESLLLTEQRTRERLKVELPARIALAGETPTVCTMADFSEHSVRLCSGTGGWPDGIAAGKSLALTFRLPGRDRDSVLHGTIYRVGDNDLVLTLEQIERDGRLRPMEIIDVLQIKSCLVQLPHTLD